MRKPVSVARRTPGPFSSAAELSTQYHGPGPVVFGAVGNRVYGISDHLPKILLHLILERHNFNLDSTHQAGHYVVPLAARSSFGDCLVANFDVKMPCILKESK